VVSPTGKRYSAAALGQRLICKEQRTSEPRGRQRATAAPRDDTDPLCFAQSGADAVEAMAAWCYATIYCGIAQCMGVGGCDRTFRGMGISARPYFVDQYSSGSASALWQSGIYCRQRVAMPALRNAIALSINIHGYNESNGCIFCCPKV